MISIFFANIKFMTSVRKLILFAVGFFLLFYLCFGLAYQNLINDASLIADKQCTNVNPLIIQRKNSYLNSMKIISDKGSADDYMRELKNYLEVSNKFIAAEKKWLNEEKAYMNRWDFRLILPANIQRLEQLEYISREADVKSTHALLDMMQTTDTNKQKAYAKIVNNQVNTIATVESESDHIYKEDPGIDWRLLFVKRPHSTCPMRYRQIPEVPDLLFPAIKSDAGPIS